MSAVIEAHTLVWNERDNLRIWYENMRGIADRMIVWDYDSTDGGPEMIAKQPLVEVRRWPNKDGLLISEWTKWRNSCWKGSTADYVIVTDADEWLRHSVARPGLREFLETSTVPANQKLFRPTGYDLISLDPNVPRETVVTPGWSPAAKVNAAAEMLAPDLETGLQLWRACFCRGYSKPCVFDPRLPVEFTPGGHTLSVACSRSRLAVTPAPMMLFNGAVLGSIDSMLRRSVAIVTNRSPRESKHRPNKPQAGKRGCPIHAQARWIDRYEHSVPATLVLRVQNDIALGKTPGEIMEMLNEKKISTRPYGHNWNANRVQRVFGIPTRFWW